MKKGIVVLVLAAAVTLTHALPVQAINKEWSAVAGFVGGLLVANTYGNHHSRYNQKPVQRVVVYEEPVRTGYYTWQTRRVQIPGCWAYEDTGCGTRRKVWYPSCYTTQRYKVWVDTTCNSGW